MEISVKSEKEEIAALLIRQSMLPYSESVLAIAELTSDSIAESALMGRAPVSLASSFALTSLDL